MRKAFAGLGTEFIDGAVVAVQKHASGFLGPLEDQLAIRSGLGVLFQELLARNSQVFRQADHVFFEDFGFRHPAALGALPAIDGGVNFFRGGAELALHEIMGFDPAPELLIFAALFLAQAADLDQICYHSTHHRAKRCAPGYNRKIMSDRLYFSGWVRGFSDSNMLRHFGKMLDVFPFSKLAKAGPVLRVYAIEYVEPPLFERHFDPGVSVGDMIAAARDFVQPDCCVEIEAAWDLWQHHDDWKLWPSAVTLSCFGSEFEHENDDNLRIDFGLDSKFVPSEDIQGSLRIQQSNLRSLLSLAGEIDKALPVERRLLWSESGANFAAVLEEALEKFGSG
jgi:hypothetical protein